MTPQEYHAKYGIKLDDLRRWIREYGKRPAFAAQVVRWQQVLAELEVDGNFNERESRA